MANKEEKVKVLYNCRYGGWNMSDKAEELYRLRRQEPDYIDNYSLGWDRHDPVLVQIFEELGDEFNGEHCKVGIKYIPKKYEDFYNITEYDGKENVEINYMCYEINILKENAKSILMGDMTNDDKIASLKKLFLGGGMEDD